MDEILFYVPNVLIIAAFITYIIQVVIGRTKKITNSDGFNVTKDILAEYNTINIILNKSYFTVYNIRRKVIKIASKCYYGNTITDLSLPLIEAGVCAADNSQNKIINILRKLCSNLKVLYLLPIIAIIINSQTYNISDAKISLIILLLIAIISYTLIDIKSESLWWIYDKIDKLKTINQNNRKKIIHFIKNILLLDKIIFIGELIMIIRCITIILDMI